MKQNIMLKEERLFEAFSMLDKDNNGKITKDELMSVLKLEKSDDKFVMELIKSFSDDDFQKYYDLYWVLFCMGNLNNMKYSSFGIKILVSYGYLGENCLIKG